MIPPYYWVSYTGINGKEGILMMFLAFLLGSMFGALLSVVLLSALRLSGQGE